MGTVPPSFAQLKHKHGSTLLLNLSKAFHHSPAPLSKIHVQNRAPSAIFIAEGDVYDTFS